MAEGKQKMNVLETSNFESIEKHMKDAPEQGPRFDAQLLTFPFSMGLRASECIYKLQLNSLVVKIGCRRVGS